MAERQGEKAAKVAKVIELHRLGLDVDGIAGELNCTRVSVYKILNRRGVRWGVPRTWNVDDTALDNIATEGQSYFLGWTATDGSVLCNAIQYVVQRGDRDHLYKLREVVKSNSPIKDGMNNIGDKKYERSLLLVCSAKLCKALEQYGIHRSKTFSVVPWQGPPHLMRHYWRAAIDGDGTIFKQAANTYKGYSWGLQFIGTEAMVRGFADFVSSELGYLSPVKPSRRIYRVAYSGLGRMKDICQLLYGEASISLERKHRLALEIINEPMSQRELVRYDNGLGMTADSLMQLYEEKGTWRSVAESLGVCIPTVIALRRRLGLL